MNLRRAAEDTAETSAGSYAKPLPRVTAAEQPFWDGSASGELRLQRCNTCGHWRFPPAPVCPSCLSDKFTWTAASGKGTVWSWIVMHQNYLAGFADDLPYTIALIELEEGPRLISSFDHLGSAELRCGAPVSVRFQAATDGVVLPVFALIGADESDDKSGE